MAHLIDKDALVAEIEKRLDELWDLLPNASDVVKDNYTKEEASIIGKYTALESFSKFLDTIEVKENIGHYELEEFARIVRGNLTGINKNVQTLFEVKYQQLTGNKMYGGYKD